MTYEKMFGEVLKNFKKAKLTDFTENFAFQFNITGEGEGIFYAAFSNGVLAVEPYDYKDRDVIFETDSKTIIAIASGKMEPIEAIKSGKLSIDGNHELAKQLMFLINSTKEKTTKTAASKKTAEKKTAEKKTVEKKPAAAAKTAAKKETKTASKTTAKASAAKTAAKSSPKSDSKSTAKNTKK